MQKNHGGFWSGPAGGESTMLFGGNQGADILQKLTWIFGVILMLGCFALSMYYASSSQVSKFEMVVTQDEIKETTEEKKEISGTEKPVEKISESQEKQQ